MDGERSRVRKKGFLSSLDLFSSLSDDDLTIVGNLAQTVNIEPSKVLFKQGEPAKGFYLLKEGSIEILLNRPKDTQLSLEIVQSGGIIGEEGFFNSCCRPISAIAKQKSVLYYFPQQEVTIFQMLSSEGVFYITEYLSRLLSWKIRYSAEKIEKFLAETALDSGKGDDYLPPSKKLPWNQTLMPINQEDLALLPFFQSLSAREAEQLLDYVTFWEIKRHTLIIPKSSVDSHYYIIFKGSVKITIDSVHTLGRISIEPPGTFFGFLPSIDSQPHVFNYVASENCILGELPTTVVQQWKDSKVLMSFKLSFLICKLLSRLLITTLHHTNRID